MLELGKESQIEHMSIVEKLKNMGFEHCPGCGMGHSLHYLMKLQIKESLTQHPLGIFALVVILLRIFKLFKNLIKPTNYDYKTYSTDSGH